MDANNTKCRRSLGPKTGMKLPIIILALAFFAGAGIGGGSIVMLLASSSGILRNMHQELNMNNAPSTTAHNVQKKHPCDQYNGILRISSVDNGAASGTVFFLYVVNHLIYANQHNLMPWIHFDPTTSGKVYDFNIHGAQETRF